MAKRSFRIWLHNRGVFRLLRAVFRSAEPVGVVMEPPPAMTWGAEDGVAYTMPIPVPGKVQDAGSEAMHAYLNEVSAEWRTQAGSPYQDGQPYLMPTLVDPLIEWNNSARRDVIESCRMAWERNPLAKRMVAITNQYAIQGGAAIAAGNEDVQAVLDAFIDDPDNAFRATEKSIIPALMQEGDVFLRFFTDGGDTVWTPLLPWGVQHIQHEPGFFRRVLAYHYQMNQDDGTGAGHEYINEPIPAEDVIHIAVNRGLHEQRGRPDLFAALPWLRLHKEWLENRARQNFYKGNFLVWFKLNGASLAQVNAWRNAFKEGVAPGSYLTTNEKAEVEMLSSNVGATDAKEDGRAMRQMVGVAGGVADYMLSDGENSNRATATVQESPIIMGFAEYQDIMRDAVMMPTFRRVIQNAMDAGLLPDTVPVQDADGDATGETVETLKAFDVVYPELERDDVKSAVEALGLAMNLGLMSDQTATGLAPWQLDYRQEQKRQDAEREKAMDDIAQGLRPPLFGMNGQGDDDGREDDGNEDEQPAEESRRSLSGV